MGVKESEIGSAAKTKAVIANAMLSQIEKSPDSRITK
jgi:hypothetical protein